MTKAQTHAVAKKEAQRQLQSMGFTVRVDDRALLAEKDGRRLRVIIRGQQKRGAVFLKRTDVLSADAVVVYFLVNKDCWIFTKSEALRMLEEYAATPTRSGSLPAEEGFNVSALGEPHGWQRFNSLV